MSITAGLVPNELHMYLLCVNACVCVLLHVLSMSINARGAETQLNQKNKNKN